MNPSDTTSGVPAVPTQRIATPVLYPTKVMVVFPWQKIVCPLTAFSVAQLMDRSRTASAINFGDAFVAHSRNHCANVFLQSKFEWMLTIDDDMVVPFGDSHWYRLTTGFNFPEKFLGLNALDRLLSHNKTLVGALYFGRHKDGPGVYNEGPDPAESAWIRKGPHDICKPTKWVGTGCMLIHRTVFEDIEKKFPTIARGADKSGGHWFTSTEASLMSQLRTLKNFLSSGPCTGDMAYKALQAVTAMEANAAAENSLGMGEDVSFCLRAAAAGHVPHVDLGLVCGHIGYTVFGPHNTGLK